MNLTGINKDFASDYKKEVDAIFGKSVLSTSNGISIYVDYKGWKVRFSDHETGISRSEDEVQLPLNRISLDAVEDKIARKDRGNYKEKTEIKTMLNTEYGFNMMNPNVKIIKKELAGISKKGQELFTFTYESKRLEYQLK